MFSIKLVLGFVEKSQTMKSAKINMDNGITDL